MNNKAVFFFGTVGVTISTVIQLPDKPVPRHNEIDNALAKHIKKYLGLKV